MSEENLCQTCQLTHEEVKDGHVHDVQQSRPTVIRWSLFDFLAVVRVHLPPEEFKTFFIYYSLCNITKIQLVYKMWMFFFK